jgi:tetratricopeptide (TPR) repeat protein
MLSVRDVFAQFGFPVQVESGLDPATVDFTTIRTDPELEAILEKAERFKKDNNFRVATQLLQLVLERSGDALYSDDGQIYYSLVRQVEQRLGELPPEGLVAYRVNADAEAKGLMAVGKRGDEIVALNQIVSKYFISSVGDEAAVRLGSLYLERYDFVGARRMFEKALRHPDSDLNVEDVRAKIAVCDLFLGDLDSAETNVGKSLAENPEQRSARLVADKIISVRNGEVQLAKRKSFNVAEVQMPLGSASRHNVSQKIDSRMHCDQLVAAFQYYFEPKTRYRRASDTRGLVLGGEAAFGKPVDGTRNGIESRLLSGWFDNRWRPSGMLLFAEGQAIFETAQDLVSLKTASLPIDTAELVSEKLNDDSICWRSVWTNRFAVDHATMTRQTIEKQFGGRGISSNVRRKKKGPVQPSSVPEVQLFGDQIASQMSICNGVLYSIEGDADDGIVSRRIRVQRNTNWGQGYTRSRSNRLVAYDIANNGTVLWQLPAQFPAKRRKPVPDEEVDEEESEFLTEGGLMGAPVGFGEFIVAPVNRGGAIWIYALDPNNRGKTVWKSYLCDEPATGAKPWSPINLSIDGSDIFVSCGLGVTFVLDASTGQVRIARRYERSGREDRFFRENGWGGLYKKIFDQGWSSDTIIPYGRQLVCFCSDAKRIESIDRETGQLLWEQSFDPISRRLDYLLGVYDGVLYAGGTETVAAISLDSGRLLWGGDPVFGGDFSFGKGMLTPDGIYVPVGQRILRFALKPEVAATMVKPVDDIKVDLGGAPVGNLFSDGERIWVHGGNRVYALEVNPK